MARAVIARTIRYQPCVCGNSVSRSAPAMRGSFARTHPERHPPVHDVSADGDREWHSGNWSAIRRTSRRSRNQEWVDGGGCGFGDVARTGILALALASAVSLGREPMQRISLDPCTEVYIRPVMN